MPSRIIKARVPAEIASRLDADVARSGRSESTLLREILAKHYRVKLRTEMRVGRPKKQTKGE